MMVTPGKLLRAIENIHYLSSRIDKWIKELEECRAVFSDMLDLQKLSKVIKEKM